MPNFNRTSSLGCSEWQCKKKLLGTYI